MPNFSSTILKDATHFTVSEKYANYAIVIHYPPKYGFIRRSKRIRYSYDTKMYEDWMRDTTTASDDFLSDVKYVRDYFANQETSK